MPSFFSRNSDDEWIKFGSIDPYYGVLTLPQYHSFKLDPVAEEQFWQTGKHYFEEIEKVIHSVISPDFIINRALDFGCGVGRILLPLSEVADEVVGIDISEGMMNEARKKCSSLNIQNVSFAKSDDALSQVKGSFNFIHSFIVFQHIPVKRGETILKNLLSRLDEKGIGIIHLTYSRRASPLNQAAFFMIKKWALLSGIWNLLRKKPFDYPVSQMNSYNLNIVFRILQEAQCHNIHVRFTNHSGRYQGVILFFQKGGDVISGID